MTARPAAMLAIVLLASAPAVAAERRSPPVDSVPAAPATERLGDDLPEACRPGLGVAVDTREIAPQLREGQALAAPRDASLSGAVDRALLCPGLDEGIPCLVRGPVVLQCVRLGMPLDLRHTVIRGGLDLAGAHLPGGLHLADVDILGPLSLAGASAGGAVVLERVMVAGEVRLDFASFARSLALRELRVVGPLTLQGAEAAQPVELTRIAALGDVDLSLDSAPALAVAGAEVAGDILLHGVVVDDAVSLERTRSRGRIEVLALETRGGVRLDRVEAARGLSFSGAIGAGLRLERVVTGADLELVDVTVGGPLSFADCRAGGELFLAAVEVVGSLELLNCELEEGADLGDAEIGGELALVGSRFGRQVRAARASFGAGPRIAACSPPDPLEAPPPGRDPRSPPN